MDKTTKHLMSQLGVTVEDTEACENARIDLNLEETIKCLDEMRSLLNAPEMKHLYDKFSEVMEVCDNLFAELQ